MNVLIIGVGLIGGSFALALRDRGLAERIEGVEASEEHARRALERGLVDRIVTLEEGLPSADLIVLATPVDTIPLLTVKILNRIAPHQVVMDTGSIKGELCEVVAMHARRGRFVATHPMWGTEYSGPDAASRGAFAGRTAVICERERSDRDAVETVERLYGALGMPLVSMEPEEHDLHTAYVSHISHITSFALALTVLEKEREEQHIFDLAGGGFESTVRLAKSAPRTWVPILLRNKYNVLDVLREHIHQLQIMRRMIERDEAEVDGGHAAGQCHSEDPAVTFPPSADTGRRGEQAAVDYLRRVGFAILERNWRSGRYELDIVARRWDELHFIEVKTRRAGGLTTPEEAITPRKFASLRRAAEAYMAQHRVRLEPQFDLAAVDLFPNGSLNVRFTERAMECNW
mgnify:CR=1 FL=1